ncbi:MAG: hypothetical protein ACYSU1_07275 [Planctomycetota bacterium]|jgi:hypothetical protein
MALHLDLSGLFGDGSDARLTRASLAGAMPRAVAAREAHLADVPLWRTLHARAELQESCRARAAEVKARGDVDYFVVLGIGGSALGNTAMISALAPVYQEWAPEEGQPRQGADGAHPCQRDLEVRRHHRDQLGIPDRLASCIGCLRGR